MTKITVAVLLALLAVSSGFQSIQRRRLQGRKIHSSSSLAQTTPEGDFPPEEESEYAGSVDWDAEWKKVVANDGKASGGGERPGKDFYKSEAEIAAIKAVNKASEKAVDIGSSVSNAMPDVGSWSGDWKFWVAILAVVSIGISVLSAPPEIPTNIPTGGSPDSYYI